ncbi:PRC-barrel domain-containing protein [Nocardiopsis listeri]|uniref:PRC-barrel domain-containing protein n=1 Tax=Nocardiopsis listeri TaxID=53440 RepID=UPI00083313FC|nr:PRC-barrel domain-containing protein [Nocardiopsis listeri]
MRRLRANAILGLRVIDRDGEQAGIVHDIVVDHRDGVYTILGLVLGRSAVGGRFGYGDSLQAPMPWKRLLKWLRRHERYVRWADVVALEEDHVEIAVDHGSLPGHWRQDS